ncbi:MAG: type IV secretion system DNA-binding domain-containing protein [Proteobacteria bacterium]|nr:type IV secretion system DNA-binding domain-containing protein [Pseudomonadota bacterium]
MHHLSLTDLLVNYALTLVGGVIGLTIWRTPRWRMVLMPLVAVPVAAAVVLAGRLLLSLPSLHLQVMGTAGTRLCIATVCVVAGFLCAIRHWTGRAQPKVLRGARVLEVPAQPDGLFGSQKNTLRLGGHRVPPGDEGKHFKILGTTGTGKTTAISLLLEGALERGDRAVIADPDGVFLKRFFDESRGDQILGPLHPQSSRWDLFAEVRHVQDADGIARALVPDQAGDDRTWRSYARVLVSSTIRQLIVAQCPDLAELHRLVTVAPVEELRDLLDGTPAAAYLTDNNARFFASVRAITSSELASLELVASQRVNGTLSVREWVDEGSGKAASGVLFLPYKASHLATVRGLIACWLRIALFETMEQKHDAPPLWFIVDELDSLGTIDGLKDALTRVRKYGGRCVLGMQSIAQLTGNYGGPTAQTIVENCGNTLLLRCSASENGGTARFASALIGDREVLRTQISRTRPGLFGKHDPSQSATLQQHIERAVLPAQIEQLPDLHGYLKFASMPEWRRVVILS